MQQSPTPHVVYTTGIKDDPDPEYQRPAHDRLVNPASTRALAELVPGAELLEYPDAGHLFTPAEEVHWAADAEDFLNRHGL